MSTTSVDKDSVDNEEPLWGHPYKSQVRRNTSTAEKVAGLLWLSVGALCAVLLEVFYLHSRLTVGSYSIPIPWPLIFAPWFNAVLIKTAYLWVPRNSIASIPFIVWILGIMTLMLWPALPVGSGDMLLDVTIRSMLLIMLGLAGGFWQLTAQRIESIAPVSHGFAQNSATTEPRK